MRIVFIVAPLSAALIACTSSAPGPSCAEPAPLIGTFDPAAPEYMVEFRAGVDPAQETAKLELQYGFTRRYLFTAVFPGFSAMFDNDVRDALRCESAVKSVSYDACCFTIGGPFR